MFYFISINFSNINRRELEKNSTCDICNVVVLGTSYAKLMRSKNHIKNEKILTEWLFKEEQAPMKKPIKKVYSPKTLKQIARENI